MIQEEVKWLLRHATGKFILLLAVTKMRKTLWEGDIVASKYWYSAPFNVGELSSAPRD